MKYEITMERTLRVAIEFEAANDQDAETKACKMLNDAIANPEIFDGGDMEYDYALCDEDGNEIIPWH